MTKINNIFLVMIKDGEKKNSIIFNIVLFFFWLTNHTMNGKVEVQRNHTMNGKWRWHG